MDTIPHTWAGRIAMSCCLTLGLIGAPVSGAQGQEGMKVILDSETFSPQAVKDLDPVAVQVTAIIDALIPGHPRDYPSGGIVCFDATKSAGSVAWQNNPPPITLTGPKLPGEPGATVAGTLRIALFGIQPSDKWRLALQLSHELAHVKMGARIDNYLEETFAVAASYEVLRRLGFEGYLLKNKGIDLEGLPPQIQKSISWGEWKQIGVYWIERSKLQGNRMDDRPFQTLGAILLLRDRGPNWSDLFDISRFNSCPVSTTVEPFRVCPPDISKMRRAKHELKALGLR